MSTVVISTVAFVKIDGITKPLWAAQSGILDPANAPPGDLVLLDPTIGCSRTNFVEPDYIGPEPYRKARRTTDLHCDSALDIIGPDEGEYYFKFD